MRDRLRSLSLTALKFFWGGCALLASLYCLLAYLPYTYFAFIKASPYPALVWFVRHHAALYLAATLASGIAFWQHRRRWWFVGTISAQSALAVGLFVHPVLPALQNDSSSLIWSIAFLIPAVVFPLCELALLQPDRGDGPTSLFSFPNAMLVGAGVALLFAISMRTRQFVETHALSISRTDFELAVWSVVSHALVAMIVVSVLNLAWVVASRSSRPSRARLWLSLLLLVTASALGIARFLSDALTFDGKAAVLYAVFLAVALSAWIFSLAAPLTGKTQRDPASTRGPLWSFGLLLIATTAAIVVPIILRTRDWNGVLQRGFTLLVWVVVAVLVFRLRPARATYSVPAIVGVLLISVVTYKTMEMTGILWARSLGATDDAIADRLEQYALFDPSFEMTQQMLGAQRSEPCGDLCRIMRQYSNIRSPHVSTEVELVSQLSPTIGKRPNVFLFVMDSLRPDYLGAYNPRVDFSPHLDAFARDSVVLRNVYTPYAGTLLSEPAIWAGSLLLHAHYMQPFAKVNSLERLANTDGYRMVVSYDTVVRELLTPSDHLVRLDTDKSIWNQFEVCSTTKELEAVLDSQRGQPVFFYAQPMNVHQFARNGLPIPSSANWRLRAGFQNRVAYQVQQADACLGKFFDYLKQRKLYDDSIIIITSDHGDATGEFGRFSHSTHIYPEVMRVPLLVHLPAAMRPGWVWDDQRISSLTDIAPSLYYLLGHRPIRKNPLYGRPLFAESRAELESYPRHELFLASDVRAAYGLLAENGRFLYVTYDSPAQSFLYDLAEDPNAEHNLVTKTLKEQYDRRIIEHLRGIADYYGYRPDGGTFLASKR